MVETVRVRKDLMAKVETLIATEKDSLGIVRWKNPSEFVNEAVHRHLMYLAGGGK